MASQRQSQSILPEALADEYTCQICQEEYNEDDKKPKTLPDCLHTICRECVQRMLARNNNDEIRCPFDREPRLVPSRDVDRLPTNRTALRLLELSEGRQARQVIRSALENCRQRVDELRRCELRFEEEKSLTVAEIHEHLDGFIEHVNQEKERLTEELNAAYDAKRETLPALVQLDHVRRCIDNVNAVLQQEDTEVIVARKEPLLNEMEMLCAQTIPDDNEVAMKISFVPKQENNSLGEVKCVAKTETKDGICDQMRMLWQYVLICAIFPLCVKMEAICNTRVGLVVRYYLFESPFLTKLRYEVEKAFKPGNNIKDELFIYVSNIIVYLSVYSFLMVLGHYHIQLNSSASEAGDNSSHWVWYYVSLNYNFTYVLLFEFTIAIYLHFLVIQSIHGMFKKFKEINMAYLTNMIARDGLVSLLFILTVSYMSNLTDVIPLLAVAVTVTLAFVSVGLYFSHAPINHLDTRNGNRRASYSKGIAILAIAVGVIMCMISVVESKYQWNQQFSVIFAIILQPLLLLEILQRLCFKTEDKDFNLHLLIPKSNAIVLMFAALAALAHVTITWSQSVIPTPSVFEVFAALVAFGMLLVASVYKKTSEEVKTWVAFISLASLYIIHKSIGFLLEVGFLGILVPVFLGELFEENQNYLNKWKFLFETIHLILMFSALLLNHYLKLVAVPALFLAVLKVDYDGIFGDKKGKKN